MIKVALTPPMPCSYLSEQQEQILVVQDDQLHSQAGYEVLLLNGFRRSGNDVYRPHCQTCQACQSIRIDSQLFKVSKSQKRLLKKNKHIEIRVSHQPRPDYYPLYERYINTLHSDGAMFPASQSQYDGFITSAWLTPTFLEFYLNDTLIAVAVTDVMANSMSAMYCFYDPNFLHNSLGTYAILQQLLLAKATGKQWLYLGYQIDQCGKMNYKVNFNPHERLVAGKWQD
ncbi:arginyltransferase [Moritella sp. 28]|uniref:arginyltransferase n=1 Tax=Moritella sp. 28 TaxID=2746232 RepID=UPI001BA88E66|nr:arginyltransferase [Moritella sp. 28]QUM83945.1 arginyltransferase [Moritella sp. 28]